MATDDDRRDGRVLGIDLGSVRIGLALSDRARILASPYRILTRGHDRASDHRAIVSIVEENDVREVVVGLPLLLTGRSGEAALSAQSEIEALRGLLRVPVHARDERLSTVEATRRRQGLASSKRRGGSRALSTRDKEASRVDDAAAAIVLQSYLDETRSRSR